MVWTLEFTTALFEKADKDKSGCITPLELQDALSEYQPGICSSVVAGIFVAIDKSEDSKISLQELVSEMVDKKDRGKGIAELFEKYDSNGNGTLSPDELRKVLAEYAPPDRVDAMFDKFMEQDVSKDGQINRAEFDAFFNPPDPKK